LGFGGVGAAEAAVVEAEQALGAVDLGLLAHGVDDESDDGEGFRVEQPCDGEGIRKVEEMNEKDDADCGCALERTSAAKGEHIVGVLMEGAEFGVASLYFGCGPRRSGRGVHALVDSISQW